MQAVGTAAPRVAPVRMERVWDRTAAFVRSERSRLLPLAGFAIFVSGVISGLAAAASTQNQGADARLWAVFALVAALLALWGELAIVASAAGQLRTRAAIHRAGLRLWVVIALAALLALATLLLALPAVAILGGYGFDFAAAAEGDGVAPPPAAAAWIGLYGLVLLPLLLWIGARVSLVVPVVVVERHGIGALARSWRLTRGIAGKVVGMAALYGLVLLVLTAAVRFGGGTVFALAFGSDDGLGVASILTLLLVTAVQSGMTVLLCAFVGTLYLAARERQDGTAAHR